MEPELDRPDPVGDPGLHAGDPLLGREPFAGRGVRDQRVRSSAQQPPERLAERASDQIPHRDLDGPRPAPVEVDRLADAPDHLGPTGIDADEESRQELGVRQGRAARHPERAVVGVHEHDRLPQAVAGNGIPRGAERRIERELVPPDLDPLDPHRALPEERVVRLFPPGGHVQDDVGRMGGERIGDRGPRRGSVRFLHRRLVVRRRVDPHRHEQHELVRRPRLEHAVRDRVQHALCDPELRRAPRHPAERVAVDRGLVHDDGGRADDDARFHAREERHVSGTR